MNLTAAPAQVNPAAIVLFDSADRRTPRPFGRGLSRSLPTHRLEYSAADSAWWAEESARIAEARELAELNAQVEAMARDAAMFAAYMADADCYAHADDRAFEPSR